jgi:four helix bundle protein
MKGFKELKVWQKAHAMTLAVYDMTRTFPREELYGLTSQLRRSAASVGANIAEGCGRRSDGEIARFLQIAR